MKRTCWFLFAAVGVVGFFSELTFAQQSSKTATGVTEAVVVPAQGAPSPAEMEVAAASKKLMDAFNEGKVDAVVEQFLPDAELIDDSGAVHLGKDEITTLLKSFYERYPGVQSAAEVESIRLIAGLALVDGTRVLSDKDGKNMTVLRFAAIWKKTDAGYKLASLRDVSEVVPVSPSEALSEISWIIGSWVNEGSDGKVELEYRFTDEGNFIVGDLSVLSADGTQVMKSVQRIGWDASEGRFKSWTFDSDGGWGEAVWTATDSGWTLQSNAVAPDGQRGTAVVTISAQSTDRFVLTGTHRSTEGIAEPDYEHVVVRKAPAPTKP